MPRAYRRYGLFIALSALVVYLYYSYSSLQNYGYGFGLDLSPVGFHGGPPRDAFRKWRVVNTHFPLKKFKRPPGNAPAKVPRLQHDFSVYHESEMHKAERKRRREAVKEAFEHTWKGYSKHAWLHDELKPISGGAGDPFGSWGATLVDSLDTLWIMGMEKEFMVAVAELRKIDFTRSAADTINLFETTIRYLGGLLGAYDLTDRKYDVLLHKAIELGEMLYHAFDTPNHMPITRWRWKVAEAGEQEQSAPVDAIVAEIGSLSLEFTRLTQLTGDNKYFDAIQRITNIFKEQQNSTNLPGLFPLRVNPLSENFHTGSMFTVGGQADSLYEYFAKMYLLLEGRDEDYRKMWEFALDTTKNFLAFEPLIPLQSDDDPNADSKPTTSGDDKDEDLTKRTLHKRDYNFSPDYSNPILLGTASVQSPSSSIDLQPTAQHLACFMGGTVAIAARTFSPFHRYTHTEENMDLAERLTAGCVWSYRATPTKLGPEMFHLTPCRRGRAAITSGQEPDWTGSEPGKCRWDRDKWLTAVRERHLPHMDPAQLALDESDDPDFWPHFVRRQNLREGFVDILDRRYVLRPETIESVFVLWRLTGDPKYQDTAWDMFEAMHRLARTKIAYAGVADVMSNPSLAFASAAADIAKRSEADDADNSTSRADDDDDDDAAASALAKRAKAAKTTNPLIDSMESFWPAETLKYFYLVFAEPEVVSLDEYVFNTEAHPFRWRKGPPKKGVDNG